jgi:hypothetical protein
LSDGGQRPYGRKQRIKASVIHYPEVASQKEHSRLFSKTPEVQAHFLSSQKVDIPSQVKRALEYYDDV